jgi:hypothetical protein
MWTQHRSRLFCTHSTHSRPLVTSNPSGAMYVFAMFHEVPLLNANHPQRQDTGPIGLTPALLHLPIK